MSFVHPAVLLLLALVPLAGLGLARAERSRRRALEEFGDPDLLARSATLADPGARRRRDRLRIAALTLLLVALARPQLGERPSDAPHTGRDLLVLLDLSRSMNSPDIEPNRLAGAKEAVLQLAASLPGDRVGLIVFGGAPFLLLPLTQDRATLQLFLDHARTEYLYDPSTDIASALLSALTVYQHEGSRGSRAVILVSDGEAPDRRLPDVTSLDWPRLAAQAQESQHDAPVQRHLLLVLLVLIVSIASDRWRPGTPATRGHDVVAPHLVALSLQARLM